MTINTWVYYILELGIRLTDDVADALGAAVLEFGQHGGLKGQRRHAEEEIPDAVTWNTRGGGGGEGSGSRFWGVTPPRLTSHLTWRTQPSTPL